MKSNILTIHLTNLIHIIEDSFNSLNVNVNDMGHVARKPVFGVSDKASFKLVSSATGTS